MRMSKASPRALRGEWGRRMFGSIRVGFDQAAIKSQRKTLADVKVLARAKDWWCSCCGNSGRMAGPVAEGVGVRPTLTAVYY